MYSHLDKIADRGILAETLPVDGVLRGAFKYLNLKGTWTCLRLYSYFFGRKYFGKPKTTRESHFAMNTIFYVLLLRHLAACDKLRHVRQNAK